MNRYREILPSFDALVFFEAAVRLGTCTRAAEELSVTQAAVSKRIREIEAHLGNDLFDRHGRRLELNDFGRHLYKSTLSALEGIEEACKAAGNGSGAVTVAANSAVNWLSGRLSKFEERSSLVNICLQTSAKDVLDPDNDIVVLYGNGDIPGWRSVLLTPEELAPVATPGYIERLGVDASSGYEVLVDSSSGVTLLEYERLYPDWINFQDWFQQVLDVEVLHSRFTYCDTYADCIDAALRGEGIALGSIGLFQEEIDGDRLAFIGGEKLVSGRSHVIASPEKRALSCVADGLWEWLIDAKHDQPSRTG